MSKSIKLWLLILCISIFSYAWGNVEIYKIATPYDPPNAPMLHIKIDEQILYIGIVNKDDYEHRVKIVVECNGKKYDYGYISLAPNSHIENVIELRVPITDDKEHDVKVSLVDDEGKTIASKTFKIKVIFPIDVKNITCSDGYYLNKNTQVCFSNWFKITLKSNPYASSDYIAKVWIVAKSGNNVIYDGINNSQTVYIPYGEEKTIYFKIPEINITDDNFKITTYVEVLNVTHSVDGYEETIQRRDKNGIWFDYKSEPMTFLLPVVIKNIKVYNKIDDNTSNIVKNFYYNAWIDDDIEKAINDKYYRKYVEIPRYYVKDDDRYLAILKVDLENKYNEDVNTKFVLCYDNYTVVRDIKLNKTSTGTLYIPIYPKLGNVKIYSEVYPDINYLKLIYRKETTLNPNPTPISPIKIVSISLPQEKSIIRGVSKNSGYVLVGKTYNMTITLYNIYNKTLTGKIIVYDKLNKKGIVNYTSNIYFIVPPHTKKDYNISIKFNREFNGDLYIKVVPDEGAKDSYATVHFNAIYPIRVEYLKYITPLVKINAIKYNNSIYVNKPVVGIPCKVEVKFANKLNIPLNCEVYLEVINRNGTIEYISPKKDVLVENDSSTVVTFPITFKEGFKGYTVVHIIPKNLGVDIIFGNGLGLHPVSIPNEYEIGRYSALDLLGNSVPTKTFKLTEVISPVYIENITINNSKMYVKLSNKDFPLNITAEYWTSFNETPRTISIPPNSYKVVEIPLKNINSNKVEFYIKVDKFIILNNTIKSIVLKKEILIKDFQNISNIVENVVENETTNTTNTTNNNITNLKENITINPTTNNPSPKNTMVKETQQNTSNMQKEENNGLFGFISSIISGIINRVFQII
ncbi:hypothetical protein ACPB8Q_06815 [Methanocaldococcus indicus]|uniref:hypothetical protein n=1 Tax=Methanocaldococcus indicus TaxID=213231 RepID=UPI003C6CD982